MSGSTDRGLQGFFFESEDGHDIAQFRSDGFTYSRLKPYTDGEQVLSEALRLWGLFVEVAAPTVVSRLALRYINHLRLEVPLGDLGQYLNATPAPPQGAGEIEGFLTRVVTHEARTNVRVITTQILERAVDPGALTVILDIDSFRLAELGLGAGDLRPTLEALRSLKNDVFFGSITERTAGLYE